MHQDARLDIEIAHSVFGLPQTAFEEVYEIGLICEFKVYSSLYISFNVRTIKNIKMCKT